MVRPKNTPLVHPTDPYRGRQHTHRQTQQSVRIRPLTERDVAWGMQGKPGADYVVYADSQDSGHVISPAQYAQYIPVRRQPAEQAAIRLYEWLYGKNLLMITNYQAVEPAIQGIAISLDLDTELSAAMTVSVRAYPDTLLKPVCSLLARAGISFRRRPSLRGAEIELSVFELDKLPG